MVINRNSIRLIIISTLTFLVFFSGCSGEKPIKESKNPDEKIVLKIGLIPEQNIFGQLNRYKHIGDYLESKTKIKIEFKALTKYGDIVTDFEKLELDGAFFGSFIYTIAHSKLGVIPIARPENPKILNI